MVVTTFRKSSVGIRISGGTDSLYVCIFQLSFLSGGYAMMKLFKSQMDHCYHQRIRWKEPLFLVGKVKRWFLVWYD